jgi:hypothetical protein
MVYMMMVLKTQNVISVLTDVSPVLTELITVSLVQLLELNQKEDVDVNLDISKMETSVKDVLLNV